MSFLPKKQSGPISSWKRGATLLEVLFASFLLITALSLTIFLINHSFQSESDSGLKVRALHDAQNVLEECNTASDDEEELLSIAEYINSNEVMLAEEHSALMNRVYFLHAESQKKKSMTTVKEYIHNTNPVINSCLDIMKQEMSGSKVDTRLISVLVSSYLKIASNYIDINKFSSPAIHYNECITCKNDISGLRPNHIGEYMCPYCNSTMSYSSRDITIYGCQFGSKRTTNSSRDGFKKMLYKHRGVTSIEIPDSLIKKLDRYYSMSGLPPGHVIRSMNYADRDQFISATKIGRQSMIVALEQLKKTSYIQDISTLINVYWGIPLPDTQHLDSIIMDDYDRSEEAYREYRPSSRTPLGLQYRLFRHLQLRGAAHDYREFKIATTAEILNGYETCWLLICNKMGWKYIILR